MIKSKLPEATKPLQGTNNEKADSTLHMKIPWHLRDTPCRQAKLIDDKSGPSLHKVNAMQRSSLAHKQMREKGPVQTIGSTCYREKEGEEYPGGFQSSIAYGGRARKAFIATPLNLAFVDTR